MPVGEIMKYFLLIILVMISLPLYSYEVDEIEPLNTVILDEPHKKDEQVFVRANGIINVYSRVKTVIGRIQSGDQVILVKELDEYYKIIYPMTGYIFKASNISFRKEDIEEYRKKRPEEAAKQTPVVVKKKTKPKKEEVLIIEEDLPAKKESKKTTTKKTNKKATAPAKSIKTVESEKKETVTYSGSDQRLYKKRAVGLRLGMPIATGDNGDSLEASTPYIGVFWKNRFMLDRLFYEFELGYFGQESEFNSSNTVDFLPITISFLYQFQLLDWLSIAPKAGLGIMPAFASSGSDYFYFLFKVAPELTFHLYDDWAVVVEMPIHMGIETGGDFDAFFIPSVGAQYQF